MVEAFKSVFSLDSITLDAKHWLKLRQQTNNSKQLKVWKCFFFRKFLQMECIDWVNIYTRLNFWNEEKIFNYPMKKFEISAKKIKQTKDEPTTYYNALLFWYSVQATISINKYFPLCSSQFFLPSSFTVYKFRIIAAWRKNGLSLDLSKLLSSDAIEIQMRNIHIK